MKDDMDPYSEEAPAKEGRTALLPRSFLGSAKPGDTITLKVGRVLEDEVEVSECGKESEDEETDSPEMPKSAMDESMDEMDQTASGMTA